MCIYIYTHIYTHTHTHIHILIHAHTLIDTRAPFVATSGAPLPRAAVCDLAASICLIVVHHAVRYAVCCIYIYIYIYMFVRCIYV